MPAADRALLVGPYLSAGRIRAWYADLFWLTKIRAEEETKRSRNVCIGCRSVCERVMGWMFGVR